VSASFRYRRQVQFAETDLAGIVHFSRYFRFMEEAEHALWRAAGLSIAPANPVHGWPRVAAAFDYKRPLRFEDQFTVAVRISAVSRRTIRYGFELRRDHTFIGHGTITVACVTVAADGVMASVELPDGLVTRLTAVMTEASSDEPTTGP
jgi:YbgC/YbaW family acyl-CoA thioester hydrolase